MQGTATYLCSNEASLFFLTYNNTISLVHAQKPICSSIPK
ncbi:hypothetical protein VDIAB_100300 [Vibrio diabolicus]|nr:hypothetical protein VDIAB_100300 [Vibrio diabolicus]